MALFIDGLLREWVKSNFGAAAVGGSLVLSESRLR